MSAPFDRPRSDGFGCEYKDRCALAETMSIDELECCTHEYEQCPIWQRYRREESELWGEKR